MGGGRSNSGASPHQRQICYLRCIPRAAMICTQLLGAVHVRTGKDHRLFAEAVADSIKCRHQHFMTFAAHRLVSLAGPPAAIDHPA